MTLTLRVNGAVLIVSVKRGKRDIEILGELSIVDETF